LADQDWEWKAKYRPSHPRFDFTRDWVYATGGGLGLAVFLALAGQAPLELWRIGLFIIVGFFVSRGIRYSYWSRRDPDWWETAWQDWRDLQRCDEGQAVGRRWRLPSGHESAHDPEPNWSSL
jgi:hypothetical protein